MAHRLENSEPGEPDYSSGYLSNLFSIDGTRPVGIDHVKRRTGIWRNLRPQSLDDARRRHQANEARIRQDFGRRVRADRLAEARRA